MIWVVLIVVVGMVVILIQLLLAFQRRSARLKLAQNPVRAQITSHTDKLDKLVTTVGITADEALEKLQKDMAVFTRRSGHAANVVADLDTEAHARLEEMRAEMSEEERLAAEAEDELREQQSPSNGAGGELDELLGSKGPGMRIESDRLDPVETVKAIRQSLEEAYNYMENMRMDAKIVRQTANRIGPADQAEEESGD